MVVLRQNLSFEVNEVDNPQKRNEEWAAEVYKKMKDNVGYYDFRFTFLADDLGVTFFLRVPPNGVNEPDVDDLIAYIEELEKVMLLVHPIKCFSPLKIMF